MSDQVLEVKNTKPLPPSSKIVLRILGKEGALTHKDLVKKSKCSPRTVRFALLRLKENQMIIEKANMQDMRQIIYQDVRIPVRKSWLSEFGYMNTADREKSTG